MTSRRIDQFLLGLGALLILFSSYQLFFKSLQSEHGLTLGTLTSTLSVVKTKNALSLDWRDAVSGNELTQNQLIYTDSKSSAEVLFKEGGSLQIGENSLIKLKASGNEQSMNIEKGFIRAKLQDDKPITIQMNGEDYTVTGNGADIQINLQDEKGEIGVISGSVKVQGEGVSENLTTTTALSIDGNTLSKKIIYFKDTTPENSSVIYSVDVPTQVHFTWKPLEAAKVIVGKNPTLEGATIVEGAGVATGNLAPGVYFYRVEGEKGVSLLGKFRVVQETPPEILRPLSGRTVDVVQKEKATLLLQWKDEARLSYALEWFDTEAHSAVVKGSSFEVPVARSGIFRWRVKIHAEDRPEAVWSNWQDIKINLVAFPEVPKELSPHEVEFQTFEAPQEKIEFEWKSKHPVEFELVDPKGETTVKKIETNFTEAIGTMAGAYRWRVRALDNFLRASEWSEWRTFTIMDLSGEKSKEGAQRFQLKKPDQSVTFNWKSSPGAVSVFELAKDPQFKTIVKKIEVSKDSIQVSVPEIGTYYWRSREFLSNGTIHVSEPRRVIIEPVPAPEKPEKLPDMEVPIEELPMKTTLLESMINFIIPSAHADDLKGLAHITLPAKEEAKAYIVRIYRDQGLTDLAFEKEITQKEFIWKKAEPGTYYWQYAVIDFWDRKSLFSDPAILTIKGELAAPPEKPKLISPIRAKKIDNKDLKLEWSDAEENFNYEVEVATDDEFKHLIIKKETKNSKLDLSDLKLESKLHYWRVRALNKKRREVLSNTGRFLIAPPLERIVVADQLVFKKNWKKRFMALWMPSMDSYKFTQDGQSGQIDGNVLMGIGLSGTYFFERGALNGELIRQSGKVFEKEEYLFQRLMVDYVYTWNFRMNHKLGAGLAVGQTSGQAYEINSGVVSAKAESGLSYGVALRNYLSFNETWEMQGKFLYLTGDISQMELGADALYHQKNYFWVGGVTYSSRSYKTNEGEQSSLRLSLGIGKEF